VHSLADQAPLPQAGFVRHAPDAVDLTLTDGRRVLLEHPVLRDSIIEDTDPEAGTVRQVPTSRIAAWSVRRPGASRDGKLLAGVVGLAGLFWMATWDPWDD
jgi:hypothetical protein